MRVIKPATYQPRPVPRRRSKWWLIGLILLLCGSATNYLRPLPSATTTFTVSGLSANTKPTIAWPTTGQAAIAAPGYGILGTQGAQTPLATASIAKVITALCVLDRKPLQVGESGPTYTVSANDVQIYNDYVTKNGSVAAVAQGEKLTEYQALQALMIPSANNIADSLVNWVFGSHAQYATYAANFLTRNGMSQTLIGNDASGYDPSTSSSASDLTTLGLLALKSPVLMEIAGQKKVTLPVAGTVTNYNTIIGVNGITGLKTGNNDEDPGAFLFTAEVSIGSKVLPVTGAVMGAPDLQTALDSSVRLSASMRDAFEEVTVVKKDGELGTVRTAWGASEPIVANTDVRIVRWKDTAIGETHTIKPSTKAGTIGSMQVNAPGSSSVAKLQLKADIPGPSFWWRLTRH